MHDTWHRIAGCCRIVSIQARVVTDSIVDRFHVSINPAPYFHLPGNRTTGERVQPQKMSQHHRTDFAACLGAILLKAQLQSSQFRVRACAWVCIRDVCSCLTNPCRRPGAELDTRLPACGQYGGDGRYFYPHRGTCTSLGPQLYIPSFRLVLQGWEAT